jgi:hypothetical protein
MGAVAFLAFVLANILFFVMGSNQYVRSEELTLGVFAFAVIALLVTLLLLLLLAFGVGGKGTRWRTPLLCLPLLLWCLVAGGLVSYNFTGRGSSGEELIKLMESKGLKSGDALYDDVVASIAKDKYRAGAGYVLLLSGFAVFGCLVIGAIKRPKTEPLPNA